MNDELVTIATFGNSIEANLAKEELKAAGIQAFVVGDDAGSVLSVMTSSIGMQLRVRREDLKASLQVLREIDSAEPATEEATDEELFDAPPDKEDASQEDRLTQRELDADRAFRSAIIGFFFCPLQIYTSWLLCRVYFSNERLEAKHRRRAWIAFAIAAPYAFLFLVFLKLLLSG